MVYREVVLGIQSNGCLFCAWKNINISLYVINTLVKSSNVLVSTVEHIQFKLAYVIFRCTFLLDILNEFIATCA